MFDVGIYELLSIFQGVYICIYIIYIYIYNIYIYDICMSHVYGLDLSCYQGPVDEDG